jgi:hypothetical protein
MQLPDAVVEGRESIEHYLQFYTLLVDTGELTITWEHVDRLWASLANAADGLRCDLEQAHGLLSAAMHAEVESPSRCHSVHVALATVESTLELQYPACSLRTTGARNVPHACDTPLSSSAVVQVQAGCPHYISRASYMSQQIGS